MAKSDSKQVPARVKDETGNVYGKLTVLSYAGTDLKSQKGAYWNCRCECGGDTVVCGRSLRSESISSCGCSKNRTDEVGNPYGKLTVLEFAGKTPSGDSLWLCRCECGNTTTVARGHLRKKRGGTKSCGCHRARAGGMCESPEYTSWQEMKRRCYNSSYRDYHLYGGRGITICKRWLDAFTNFLEDMGEKPSSEHSIERIDNDGDYEPGNCKWATAMEQGQNTRKTLLLTCNGETMGLRAWARKLGIAHRTIAWRLEQGWSMEQIVDHYST